MARRMSGQARWALRRAGGGAELADERLDTSRAVITYCYDSL